MTAQRSEPVIYVKLVPRGSKSIRIDLTTRVISWTFDDNESKADKLQLTVDNWDLANFDTPVWAKGNIIEVAFGYVGNMSPARELIIKSVKGSTKLTVEAYSKKFLMDRITRCRVFENVTRSDVAKRIASENGFAGELQLIEETKKVLPFLTQARQTDAKFLRKLASKEGFEFYVDFSGFHFHKRQVGRRPLKKLIWYQDQTGTLLSFNIEDDVTKQISRKRIRGRDRIKKKDYTVEVDYGKDFGDVLAANPIIGDVTAIAVAVGQDVKAGIRAVSFNTFFAVDPTEEIDREAAKRKHVGRGRKERQLSVKMKATIVGDPQLFAKTVIRVEGIGKRLSGNYYIKSHKHTGSSPYNGVLELIRDGHSELRDSEKLFGGGRGGGRGASGNAKGCAASVTQLRKAIRSLVTVTNEQLKLVPEAGASVNLKSIINIGVTSSQMIRQEAQLKGLTKPDQVKPILAEVKKSSASFRASANGFPANVFGPLNSAGDKVQNAARRTEDECEKEIRPRVNNQDTKDGNRDPNLRLGNAMILSTKDVEPKNMPAKFGKRQTFSDLPNVGLGKGDPGSGGSF